MQKACEGAQGRHYQIPPMEKDHMELSTTAKPAVGDRAERLLSDVWRVANTHTKNVLIVYTQIGKEFSTNIPFLIAEIST